MIVLVGRREEGDRLLWPPPTPQQLQSLTTTG